MKLALIYSILAVIATLMNIFTQDLVVSFYDGKASLVLAVAAGTVVGLVIKYALDKRYIFSFRAHDVVHDCRVFVIYALIGCVTTVIFWTLEFGFDHLFGTKEMRYFGGIIGLAIGYTAKYHLDKRFVFCGSQKK